MQPMKLSFGISQRKSTEYLGHGLESLKYAYLSTRIHHAFAHNNNNRLKRSSWCSVGNLQRPAKDAELGD